MRHSQGGAGRRRHRPRQTAPVDGRRSHRLPRAAPAAAWARGSAGSGYRKWRSASTGVACRNAESLNVELRPLVAELCIIEARWLEGRPDDALIALQDASKIVVFLLAAGGERGVRHALRDDEAAPEVALVEMEARQPVLALADVHAREIDVCHADVEGKRHGRPCRGTGARCSCDSCDGCKPVNWRSHDRLRPFRPNAAALSCPEGEGEGRRRTQRESRIAFSSSIWSEVSVRPKPASSWSTAASRAAVCAAGSSSVSAAARAC